MLAVYSNNINSSIICRQSKIMISQLVKVAILSTVVSFARSDVPLPDINIAGIDAVKKWANDRNDAAAADFRATGHQHKPSLDYWGGEIIYSIQVDRFNDGDPTINNLNLPPEQQQHGNTATPYGLPGYRHGGDIQGIIDRLEYVVDLGASALWITPILKHNGDYHGYCTTDPTNIDPGFGSAQLFRELVVQAHARNISVFMDIVINHMCDRETSYTTPPKHEDCTNDLNAEHWSGSPSGSGNQGTLAFAADFFPPFKSQYFFNRCGTNSNSDTDGEGPSAIFGGKLPTYIIHSMLYLLRGFA